MSSPRLLSLYTGAGGLDLGLARAGFQIAGCVEVDHDAQQTLKKNQPSWPQLEDGNIHAHSPSQLLEAFGLTPGEISLLAGGPPCQPFSKSGQWKLGAPRKMSDPRAATLRSYFDVAEAALPKALLIENVTGVTATRSRVTQKHEAFDVVTSRLKRINQKHGTAYRAVALVIDAAHYGVPQHRRRAFVFAARDGSGLDIPEPTHGESSQASSALPLKRFATAWDAIGDLDNPEFDHALLPNGKWGRLLSSIPEGSNYLHHTARGEGEPLFGWRRKYWSFLLKLAKAKPSWTVQAQAGPATGPFHWRSRRLTTREMARLQCFPDAWVIAGGYTSARRQIGNAVPPPLGELLGIEIRRQLFQEQPRRKAPMTPKLRDDCPSPEPVVAVPKEYLSLRGLEGDHPGEGQGPGAMALRTPEGASA
jgi:DNA (cytosine-5)-methyltransferase 1